MKVLTAPEGAGRVPSVAEARESRTMRSMSERHGEVLRAVIKDYIETTQPVSSRRISQWYLSLSPATVRKVMNELEGLGLLYQAHTSAGRIPTDNGFRCYVDDILEIKGLTPKERARIRTSFDGGLAEGDDVLRAASHILSTMSNLLGVVRAPRLEQIVVRRIEMLRLGTGRILMVLVSDFGQVHTRVVKTRREHGKVELEKMCRYLNAVLSGLTLREMYEKIEEEMCSEMVLYDQLRRRALKLGRQIIGASGDTDLYVEEPGRLLSQPEFVDVDRMKSLFRAFDEKLKILRILDATLESEGVKILIGSENELSDMQGCTFITSRYMTGSRAAGTVGVIGPTRMDYGRIIPMVDYVARLVTEYHRDYTAR